MRLIIETKNGSAARRSSTPRRADGRRRPVLTQASAASSLTDPSRRFEIVDPRQTKFVEDLSPKYRNSCLFIESSCARRPTDDRIYVGHKAAIDKMKFQFTPAIKALRAPRKDPDRGRRPRKTIECGILLAELIKLGRGKRILR